jgi:Zn-dependent protease with chaperone function
MTSSYALRLVCLSFAVWFLIHLLLGLAVAAFAPVIIRRVEHWRAAAAARTILILRLLPASGALFIVGAICIPSYLRLEPQSVQEDIGAACLAAAALGILTWGYAITRTARALRRSQVYLRMWRQSSTETTLAGARVWMIDGPGRTLALAGVFRPRLVVSKEIAEALPPDQLAAALEHERAHANTRDNFKRLLMLLAPAVFAAAPLERAWARFTEWSADDRASAGDSNRSLALAAALVSVARIGSTPIPPLATALMANAGDLEVRVDRLLRNPQENRPVPSALLAAALFGAATLAALTLHPGTLSIAYRVLERLVD